MNLIRAAFAALLATCGLAAFAQQVPMFGTQQQIILPQAQLPSAAVPVFNTGAGQLVYNNQQAIMPVQQLPIQQVWNGQNFGVNFGQVRPNGSYANVNFGQVAGSGQNYWPQQVVLGQQPAFYQPRLDLTANYTDPFLNRIQSLERGAYTNMVQAQIRCSQGNRNTINSSAAYNMLQGLDPTLRNGQDPGRTQYMMNIMTNGAASCY
jgi:hypothetical protein